MAVYGRRYHIENICVITTCHIIGVYSDTMEVNKVTQTLESIQTQQVHMINYIWSLIWESGDTFGVPQWRDRNRLYKLGNKLKSETYLLTYRDFQFLESMCSKYIRK
jgi:hypothetical protein